MREADNAIHTAIDLDPSDSRPYVTLAYFANALGKYNDAIEYLERAAALAGDRPYAKNDLATIYLNIGLISWQTKDYQRAEENLQRSIEVWPRAVGWYHAGRFYFDRGRLDEARDMFELAAQHVPETYPPIHLQLGRVYDLIGQKGQAKSEYEKFLNLAPPEAANRSEVMARLQNL
jgi:tetratricopeptide (TPR) repeat protein